MGPIYVTWVINTGPALTVCSDKQGHLFYPATTKAPAPATPTASKETVERGLGTNEFEGPER